MGVTTYTHIYSGYYILNMNLHILVDCMSANSRCSFMSYPVMYYVKAISSVYVLASQTTVIVWFSSFYDDSLIELNYYGDVYFSW